MNWIELYNELIENNKLEEAIRNIENDQSYTLLINKKLDFRRLETGQTEGKVYDFKSDIMFAIEFEDSIISVGKHFILDSLKSQKLKIDLEKSNDYKFTFFDFQFLLYLVFSADISSGQTWFKNSIQEILNSLKIGKVSLNGLEISSEIELIAWLKNNLFGMSSLSDEEVKNRYN